MDLAGRATVWMFIFAHAEPGQDLMEITFIFHIPRQTARASAVASPRVSSGASTVVSKMSEKVPLDIRQKNSNLTSLDP